MTALTALHDRLLRLQYRQDALADRREASIASRGALEADKLVIEEAAVCLQQAAKETQNLLKVRIEDMVQAALDIVFPGRYVFETEFVTRRDQIEFDIWLSKDGTRMNPLDSNGGGVVDVLSSALRTACWTLSGAAPILLQDEPYKHIRGAARQRLGDMQAALSELLGLQIVMVADLQDTGMAAARHFDVSIHARKSQVVSKEGNASELSANSSP